MAISIIIPVMNEEECIVSLLEEINDIKPKVPITEIVVIDDGSTDKSSDVVQSMRNKIPEIRLIKHGKRSGQSTALRTGIMNAKGPLIVTMDGDGQNNPADIELLYNRYVMEAKVSPRVLVAGQRKKRNDNLIRRFSSRGANYIRSSLLGDGVRDTGCSLKLFQRDDFVILPFFNHIHRFIPAMMKSVGVKIALVDVSHRSREKGTSKYGFWDRLWVGILDLFGVKWLMSRTKEPVETTEI